MSAWALVNLILTLLNLGLLCINLWGYLDAPNPRTSKCYGVAAAFNGVAAVLFGAAACVLFRP